MASWKCTNRTHHSNQLQYSLWWTHHNTQRSNGYRRCSNLFQKGSAHLPSRIVFLCRRSEEGEYAQRCTHVILWHKKPLHKRPIGWNSRHLCAETLPFRPWKTNTIREIFQEVDLQGNDGRRIQFRWNHVPTSRWSGHGIPAWSRTSQYLRWSLWEEAEPRGTPRPTDVPPVRWWFLLNQHSGRVKQKSLVLPEWASWITGHGIHQWRWKRWSTSIHGCYGHQK